MHSDPETLLDEARWLERVARSLVGDEHTARDLAQDAWLAAQTRSVPIRTERRAWLVGTLQRLVARAFRNRTRRSRREQLIARSGEAPSSAELTARAELHAQMLQHLRALPEQNRVVLLLRYYDDLPPRTIARQLGIPVRTVQTRLSRGLEQLRARLDAQHPRGRAGWVAALCLPRSQPTSPWSGSAAASVTAVALATTLAFVAWPIGALPAPPQSGPVLAPVQPPLGAAPARNDRTLIAAILPVPELAARQLVGTVVDWRGYPIADAHVTVAAHLGLSWPDAAGEPELRAGNRRELPTPTGRDGQFACERFDAPHELRAVATGLLTVLVPIWRVEQTRPPQIVMASAQLLQGQVVDEAGAGIAGAFCQVALTTDFDATAQRGTQGLHALHWATRTDATGHFMFAAVPAVDEARLSVQCPGHTPVDLAATSSQRAPIVLQRWRDSVTGRLLDRAGHPLVGATVGNALCAATTDATGGFRVQGTAASPLFAVATGLQPTRLPSLAAGQPHVLTAAALHFEGVLRHADGRPLAHGLVSLVDATVLGEPSAVCVLEAIAAGDRRVLHLAAADGQGRFQLEGLADRPYRLRIVDPVTAAWFETDPKQPGSVVIVAPTMLTRPEHSVLLRTADGVPLAGATVTVQSTSYLLRMPSQPDRDVVFAAGSSGVTDHDGGVLLRDVPRAGAQLRISHPATGLIHIDCIDALESRHVLERTGEVVVRLAAARNDEWLELLDASGDVLPLHCLTGVSMRTASRWPLVRGNSPVLQVPANAVQARIGSPRGITDRLPLLVRPGERIAVDG